MLKTLIRFLLGVLALASFTACAGTNEIITTRVVYVRVSATPEAGTGPVSTPHPAQTPTTTPTPTPTAPPAVILGNPLAGLGRAPAPVGGAPCGLADWLDFPLAHPDGQGARGGGDFGVYRSRYEKYHAGEDWGMVSRSSFGAPVSSAGHGQVTYAAPLGWGVDQGVVIVRHVFQDGRSFLTFYGHLDPDSVTLRPGACVARGDRIGAVGDPRGRPHLHFEIRTHMPDLPGPGYWPSDPVRAGWLPPSATIWESRLRVQEGVAWVRTDARASEPLSHMDGWGLVMMSEDGLTGLDPETGAVAWEQVFGQEEPPVDAAAVSPDGQTLYLADQAGRVQALSLPSVGATSSALTLLWDVELDLVGRPALLPLPGGGLVLAAGRNMAGLSAGGAVRWSRAGIGQLQGWVVAGERALAMIRGENEGVWELGPRGPVRRIGGLSGTLLAAGERVYLYAPDGLYLLDPAAGSSRRILALPAAYPSPGSALSLPDGSLLLAHQDRADRRLIALDPAGRLRWERSLAGAPGGTPGLALARDEVYLTVMSFDGALNLYAVDLGSGALRWMLVGGTRTPRPADTVLFGAGAGRLMLQIGGGNLVGLELTP